MFFRLLTVLHVKTLLVLMGVFFAGSMIALAQEVDEEAPLPRAPEISSDILPDPEAWYNAASATFSWPLPPDVVRVAADVTTEPDSEPQMPFDPPIDGVSVSGDRLTEGTQYLHVQFKNEAGWGEIAHRKILIDRTAPLSFTLEVRSVEHSSDQIVKFKAVDELSGIADYAVLIDESEVDRVTRNEAELGYRLSGLVEGTHTVTVRAYDKAGNTTEASLQISVAGSPIKVSVGDVYQNTLWNTFLLFVILGLMLHILRERKRFQEKEAALRKETREAERQIERIFSALRDEMYSQIRSLSAKKKLTKVEKAVMKNVDTVLAVSEAIIEKEVADVDVTLDEPPKKARKNRKKAA